MKLIALSLLAWSMSSAAGPTCNIVFDSATLDTCDDTLETHHANVLASLQTPADDRSDYLVVKFGQPAKPAQQQQLYEVADAIVGYIPHYAYIVRTGSSGREALRTVPGVQWTGRMRPIWKVDINLLARVNKSALETIPLIISLYPGEDANTFISQYARDLGGSDTRLVAGPGHFRIHASAEGIMLAETLRSLATAPEVAAITHRREMGLKNARAGWLHQSGQESETPVFDQGIFGCGQTLGVADSGLDHDHCSFRDDMNGPPPIEDCGAGAGCPAGTPDPDQRKTELMYVWSGATNPSGDGSCGHGTHVMGSITGNDASMPVDCQTHATPGGVTNRDGTAPGAKLIAQEMGGGLEYLNDHGGTIYHAAETAYQNGARIHSNSWGGGCTLFGLFCLSDCEVTYDTFTRDADQVTWDFPELALFVAAGNDGTLCPSGNNVGSPGNAKNIMSIGATNPGTQGDSMASFSSRGPALDRRLKPDFSAQGASIVSTASNGSVSSPSCDTCSESGTSMATPTAAGLAALVREYLERGFYPSGNETPGDVIPNPSGMLIKGLMINSAHSITGSGAGGGAPSIDQGWGSARLDNALYFDGDARRLWLHDEAEGPATGESNSFDLQIIDNGEPLKVTLNWYDYPAQIGAAVHLVNTLRLEVETPSGDVWTQKLPDGGMPDPNPQQGTSDSDYDLRNNVHQIMLETPETGLYEIRVTGVDVALGDGTPPFRQPYALVATGAVQAGQPELIFADSFESAAP